MLIYKNYKLLSKKEHKELLKLRNEEYIREASKNKDIIDLKEHLKWIESLNENKKYFAIFYNGEIVGGVNFTKDKVITNPKADTVLEEGDIIYTLGDHYNSSCINEMFKHV